MAGSEWVSRTRESPSARPATPRTPSLTSATRARTSALESPHQVSPLIACPHPGRDRLACSQREGSNPRPAVECASAGSSPSGPPRPRPSRPGRFARALAQGETRAWKYPRPRRVAYYGRRFHRRNTHMRSSNPVLSRPDAFTPQQQNPQGYQQYGQPQGQYGYQQPGQPYPGQQYYPQDPVQATRGVMTIDDVITKSAITMGTVIAVAAITFMFMPATLLLPAMIV
ncbi:MAG: hypothetical protein GYA85_08295, partial [Propionibacterium sp.]|nr:hypothetical protein [Propionibacterium sp.]